MNMMMTTISFRVSFEPRESWVDETYLANVLGEALRVMTRKTQAFDFHVEKIQ